MGVVVCFDSGMTKPLRVRRLTSQEGQQLQPIVRRGGGKTDNSHVKWRRALVVHASAGGNTVSAIAVLVVTSQDRVREMIHRFNEKGMASLDPQWAGGRPRQITTDDIAFIVTTANAPPETLGQPFTRWSIRKPAAFLAGNDQPKVLVGRERLRQILAENDITFQRTKTWKECPTIRIVTPSWTGSNRSSSSTLIARSRLTSSGRYRSARSAEPVERRRLGRSVNQRTITSCMGSVSSMAVTRLVMMSCGVWSGDVSRRTSVSIFGCGRPRTMWSCVSRRPIRRGRIRSKRISDRCGSSC